MSRYIDCEGERFFAEEYLNLANNNTTRAIEQAAELMTRLEQLRSDRDRLADIVKTDVCRVALVELLEAIETCDAGCHCGDFRGAVKNAEKALADTEGQ